MFADRSNQINQLIYELINLGKCVEDTEYTDPSKHLRTNLTGPKNTTNHPAHKQQTRQTYKYNKYMQINMIYFLPKF